MTPHGATSTAAGTVFARNLHADPARRARLVEDPDRLLRAHLAEGPRVPTGGVTGPLPDEAAVRMISTYGNEHLQGASTSSCPSAALPADADADVRERARTRARYQDQAWVERLAADEDLGARVRQPSPTTPIPLRGRWP